jgi:hypothetical protein
VEESRVIGLAARDVALGQYGWDSLVKQLRAAAPPVEPAVGARARYNAR